MVDSNSQYEDDTSMQNSTAQRNIKLEIRDLTISYGGEAAISDINLKIYENEIFGIIGPANAGKTSFLKSLT